MKQCRICQRPLTLIEEPAGVCHQVPCQQKAHQANAAAREQARVRAATHLHQLGRERQLVAEPDSYPVTHLPSQGRSLAPLPAARRRAFERHLDQLLAESDANPVEAPPTQPARPGTLPVLLTPEQEALSVQGCIGCRGACCQTASTHAWLDLVSMQRYRRAHPEQTREQIRLDYVTRLDQQPTFVDSCVYHGEKGCVLPREMRSWRCNTHWCGELRQLQREMAAGAPTRAFMVWPRENGKASGAFVDAEGARYVEEG